MFRVTLYRCSVRNVLNTIMKNYYNKIAGLSNYQIWTNGNTISEITGQIMGHVQPNGYVRMTLTDDDGNVKSFYGHQLVWLAFNGQLPQGHQINHIDECKTNNAIWNLEAVTPAQNNAYGTAKARRSLTLRMNKVEERIDAIEDALYYWQTREEIDGSEKVIRKTRKGVITIQNHIEHLHSELKKWVNKLKDLEDEEIELLEEIRKFERNAKKRVSMNKKNFLKNAR